MSKTLEERLDAAEALLASHESEIRELEARCKVQHEQLWAMVGSLARKMDKVLTPESPPPEPAPDDEPVVLCEHVPNEPCYCHDGQNAVHCPSHGGQLSDTHPCCVKCGKVMLTPVVEFGSGQYRLVRDWNGLLELQDRYKDGGSWGYIITGAIDALRAAGLLRLPGDTDPAETLVEAMQRLTWSPHLEVAHEASAALNCYHAMKAKRGAK